MSTKKEEEGRRRILGGEIVRINEEGTIQLPESIWRGLGLVDGTMLVFEAHPKERAVILKKV